MTKKSPPHRHNRINQIGLVIVTLISLLLLWIASIEIHRSSEKLHQQDHLIISAQQLNEQIEVTIQQLNQCQIEGQCSTLLAQLTSLENQLITFKTLASEDKSSFSLVGAIEYPKIQLAMNRFVLQSPKTSDDYQLLKNQLVTGYIELLQTVKDLESHHTHQVHDENHGELILFIALGGLLTALAFGLLFYNYRLIAAQKATDKQQENELQQLSTELSHINTQKLNDILQNNTLSPEKRAIYSQLKTLFYDIEAYQQNSDFNRQLYTLIGYEIRGITNTINGGVQYLAQEANDDIASMARDINSATKTLSDLAENYNKLIAKGMDNQVSEFSFLTDGLRVDASYELKSAT
ncbi:hypothetical protein L0B53_18460 (plasmid) [Vibrio sp. SS-MA-C1-2]|uniref:hypothetical protein n=1 Tax=Vibrio sp. SS-MA-C1-2 TaxID=2908646 RepID=UPI001F32918B|nr:hypothetical protein [Vibrio sp. SS-MA-C1-2]UJF20309.1 hypothetical protein L0B53_18460 [Vibrio sp. SS-MA-C1-2]